MKEAYIKLSQNLIFFLVAAAAFVTPLFFLPLTSEFYEFNKLTLILAITALVAFIWALRLYLEAKFTLTRTPFDLALVILILVFLASTATSIEPFISLVGAHGRAWPSLFALLTLAILYFAVVSNFKSKKQVEIVVALLVLATTLASIISLVAYFGVSLPFEFAKLRSFNTLGIINRLALLQTLVLPFTVWWALVSRQNLAKTLAAAAAIILIASQILINFTPAHLATIGSLAILALGTVSSVYGPKARPALILLVAATLLILVMRYVPQVTGFTLNAWIRDQGTQDKLAVPKELTLPQRWGFSTSAAAISKRPLLGTGPSTFASAFTQLKPRQMNSGDLWPNRFDKSSSEIAEMITTTGAVGLVAYLIFIWVLLKFVLLAALKYQGAAQKGAEPEPFLPFAAAIVAYLIAGFFVTSSFILAFAFFLLLALAAVLVKATGRSAVYDITVELAASRVFALFPTAREPAKNKAAAARAGKSQILPALFLISVTIAIALAANYQIRAYLAETNYRQALLAAQGGDGNRTISFLQKALSANPGIDTYHRLLSQTALNAALNLSGRGDLTDTQRQLLSQLAQVAIDQGKAASGYQILPLKVAGTTPTRVENWETISAVYQALIGPVTGAQIHAVNTLIQAVALDAENPILHDRLGQLYQRTGDLDSAQRKYEDSIIVKNDFGPGHYHLAKLLIEKEGDVNRIVNALTAARQFLPANDPALPDIESNLKVYQDKQKEAAQSPQKEKVVPPTPPPAGGPSPSPSPSPSPRR